MNAREKIEALAKAAQIWGWQSDQGHIDADIREASENYETTLTAALAAVEVLTAERDEALERAADLDQTFDLRWKANMRAIERWQEAHPGNDLVWPDHADMVVWLLEKMDASTAALRPFVKHYEPWMERLADSDDMCIFPRHTMGDLRRACEVLAALHLEQDDAN